MKAVGTTKSVSDEFLKFASEAIKSSNPSEGCFRSAISRAYYAVYLLARDQLSGPDGIGLKANIKQLGKAFKQRNPNKKSYLATHQATLFAISYQSMTLQQQMSQLYEARINADYFFSQTKLAPVPHLSWESYAKETVELAHLLQKDAATLTKFTASE